MRHVEPEEFADVADPGHRARLERHAERVRSDPRWRPDRPGFADEDAACAARAAALGSWLPGVPISEDLAALLGTDEPEGAT